MEMALEDVKPRPPAPVHITVLRAHDLRGVKADAPVTYVRSEFSNALLGDSPKLESAPSKPTEYNFTTSLDIGGDSPHSLDDVAHKPVLLTVIEILPKEKKQKEEKTSVLGQSAVDLLPLLRGECNFTVTVPLHPVQGSPLETAHPDAKGDATLIFSSGVLKGGGESEPVSRRKRWPMSGISAPGAQHIPESFILTGAYEEEDGEINRKEDREFRTEAETHKKRVTWDMERRCCLDQSAVTSLQKRIAECRYWPVEIMRAQYSPAGKSKPGKQQHGDEEAVVSFHGVAYINMVPLLYPGVRRLRGAYRVLAYQDAEVLEKTKRDHSVLRDVARQNSLMSRLAAVPLGVNSPHVKPTPSRLGKEEKGAKEKEGSRRMSAVMRSSEAADMDPAVVHQTGPANIEGQQYVDSGTYLVLELTLEKALVPKRKAEEVALRVKELVPVRPQLDRRTAGAQKAVADFHSQVTSITSAILEEYCQLFGQQETSDVDVDPQVLEEQKCQLNYELNCSGKYFAFKEQLKHSVVKIVREKYLKTTAFEDRDQLQTFLSELYIYLVDQMHLALNKTLLDDSEKAPPAPMTDTQQLLRFAKEAEMTEDYHQAEMYYQERLARDRQRVDHWLDYGCFKLLLGDHIKAQECFHEALAANREHLHSLLLCGVVAVILDNNEGAELFFEDATCVAPGSALAWTMLGLFYEIQGNDIRMEMAFSEAGKLHQAALTADQSDAGGSECREAGAGGGTEVPDRTVPPSPRRRPGSGERSTSSRSSGKKTPGPSSVVSKSKAGTHRGGSGVKHSSPHKPSPPASSIYMEAAKFLAQVNAPQFVQRALSHELLSLDGGPSCQYHLMCAQVHLLRKEFDAAHENLREAAQVDHQNPDVWALTGHVQYTSGRKGEARQSYEHALSLVDDASDTHPVYLRLGSIYLQEGEFEKAKTTYLLACRRSPTCLTWLGVGVACYRLEELQEAEDALSEANALNNSNAEVWGYLTLVCLKTGRQLEAEQAYKYTRKLHVQDQTLMTEIQQLQEEVGFGDPSF
ncbi:cilia- and flagella-associated protein 70 isoform X4 [Ranitomeya variabilis]|uniref:cilia- and flagella-associated protein 70 isoform X4 n=1 Tax=Ranitomeya variabilis TaxID=490064 RepID=UPI0040575488